MARKLSSKARLASLLAVSSCGVSARIWRKRGMCSRMSESHRIIRRARTSIGNLSPLVFGFWFGVRAKHSACLGECGCDPRCASPVFVPPSPHFPSVSESLLALQPESPRSPFALSTATLAHRHPHPPPPLYRRRKPCLRRWPPIAEPPYFRRWSRR